MTVGAVNRRVGKVGAVGLGGRGRVTCGAAGAGIAPDGRQGGRARPVVVARGRRTGPEGGVIRSRRAGAVRQVRQRQRDAARHVTVGRPVVRVAAVAIHRDTVSPRRGHVGPVAARAGIRHGVAERAARVRRAPRRRVAAIHRRIVAHVRARVGAIGPAARREPGTGRVDRRLILFGVGPAHQNSAVVG
ncbi:MAG: hypothetical protein P1S59_14445, partial [bacterium]|nr:hypothetical protein [bacterium]